MNRLFGQLKKICAPAFPTPNQLNALQKSRGDILQMQQFGMKMGREMLKK